ASKGLEWPVVVVPGLSQLVSSSGGITTGSVFPASPVVNGRWTENPRKLPYPLRGDAADLPRLTGLSKEELAAFDEACRARDLMEERRLAYVAVTRAHYHLIASGYRWGTAAKPLAPSDFLLEIRDAADRVAVWAPDPEPGATNPLLAEPPQALWPVEPSGPRYESVLDGARLVEEALEGTLDGGDDDEALRSFEEERVQAWERDTDLLLREREMHRRADPTTVELPAKLTVSSLVTLASDPRELARRIRRPVPVKPAPLARRGTSFHRWLETRWDQQRLIDDFELGLDAEPEEADVRLAELQERFEESEWADRRPIDMEIPFETMIADRVGRGRSEERRVGNE